MRIATALTFAAITGAAIAAMTGSAAAKNATTTISLDGYCDVLTATVAKPLIYGTDLADCGGAYGAGLLGSVKGSGAAAIIGVTSPDEPGTQLVFQLQYPFKTGNVWTLFETTDGTSMTELEEGTYTVETAPVGPRIKAPALFELVKPGNR